MTNVIHVEFARNCDLLLFDNCIVVDNVLYEKIGSIDHKYRFFYSTDDYDYVEDPQMIARLDDVFASIQ